MSIGKNSSKKKKGTAFFVVPFFFLFLFPFLHITLYFLELLSLIKDLFPSYIRGGYLYKIFVNLIKYFLNLGGINNEKENEFSSTDTRK